MSRDPLLLKLQSIIEKKIEDLCKPNNQDYDKQSWSHFQAHKNGQIQGLQEILKLLPTRKDNT